VRKARTSKPKQKGEHPPFWWSCDQWSEHLSCRLGFVRNIN